MKDPIRFAITGSGYIGAEFARIVDALPNAELVAVHSGTGAGARRVADELGCEVAPTLGELVARDDVDAVIVATPNNLHREPVTLAAHHGKHVFCEKPFALSAADCDAMLAACDDAGVRLMLGHTMHFFSGMQRAKEWIDAGVIGRPLVAHAERTGWEAPREQLSWKKQQEVSGGHLFHHIHEIDLLLWCIGDVAAVRAVGGNLAHQGEGHGDEDDVILLTLEFTQRRVRDHAVRVRVPLGRTPREDQRLRGRHPHRRQGRHPPPQARRRRTRDVPAVRRPREPTVRPRAVPCHRRRQHLRRSD